jgi:hypothetical protein
MSPFWGSLFDHLRDCGRNATLFMFALAGLLVLLLLAGIIAEHGLQRYFLYALGLFALVALAWVCVGIRRACIRRRERLQRGPLSDDELRVARSKLRKVRP